jgi:ABC-type multidrug transport system fused ATPase/permease subunit
MDYDRVMVLDQGIIVEFDTPRELLSKQEGVFKSMAEETGPDNMVMFKSMLGL